MQPLLFIVAVVLGVLALAYILYPFYRHTSPQAAAANQTDTGGQSEREQTARQALQEVEFDFQLGNLDEPDYRALRTRYMNRALLEMKDRHEREQAIDAQIETALQDLKANKKSS